MPTMKIVVALTMLVVVMQACEHNGIAYEVGDKFIKDCNECVCAAGGMARCTKKGCPPKVCHEANGDYGVGEQYMGADGCNICTCTETGVSGCTMKIC